MCGSFGIMSCRREPLGGVDYAGQVFGKTAFWAVLGLGGDYGDYRSAQLQKILKKVVDTRKVLMYNEKYKGHKINIEKEKLCQK